jgi:hypothetical protein
VTATSGHLQAASSTVAAEKQTVSKLVADLYSLCLDAEALLKYCDVGR